MAILKLNGREEKLRKELNDKISRNLELEKKVKMDIGRLSRPIRKTIERNLSRQYNAEIKAVQHRASQTIAASKQQLEYDAQQLLLKFDEKFNDDLRFIGAVT